MAKRYRIYHVRGSALQSKILFDIPDCHNEPNFPFISSYDYIMSYSTLAEFVVENSQGTILDFTDNMLYLSNVGTNLDTLMPQRGLSNKIEVNNIDVGDRFYLNRWDARHPYAVVTGKTISAGVMLTMNYCLPNGTVVYNNVQWEFTTNNAQDNTWFFPWCWNITNTSQLLLYSPTLGVYQYDSGQIIRSSQVKSYAPTSLADAKTLWSLAPIIESENPYEDAGETDTGGGDPSKQNWDNNSDAITPDSMPTKGALSSGMVEVFSPNESQVQNLADLLFSYNFFDWLQKNLQNLEELFISFGVVPFNVTTGATESVTFLGFDISQFTHPVYLTKAAQQYYEFDMGSISLTGSDDRIHSSDSVFDYSPFSRLGIYLPFIGYQELDIDECRGSTIKLVYRVDIVSGSCVALIYANGNKDRCIYQFSGNCLTQIPLGSTDMSSIISASVNIAVAASSAGASSAIASAGDALTAENLASGDISADAAKLQNAQHQAQVSHGQGSLASATVNGIMGMKPNYKHSGAIGASGGLFAVKQPYLFLITPREAVPRDYQKYCGLPSNICDELGSFSGYTVVEDIRLNGLVATSSEVEEIYKLLKSGVII